MTQHRWPVQTGDRVALAPHTDDWMRGRRFGTVTEIVKVPAVFDALRYRVEFDDGGARNLMADSLLGAIGSTVPEQTEPPCSGRTGGEHTVPYCRSNEGGCALHYPSERAAQPNEHGFTCAEFDEFGSCIHSEHMMKAGM